MNSIQSATSSSFRYSVKKTLNQISKQHLKNTRLTSTSAEKAQESISNHQKIVIPKRIERGPTDILKALSNTVKRDYTAPHYKYHDDPFLIPTSNMNKRVFAMSQESGRKAAQWIRQEHAELFQHKVADPPIEAYFPKAVYDENSEVDETVLQNVIAQHRVSDSLTIYGILEQKSVELSRATKQSLLELVCYHNGQDTSEEEWIEERWFRHSLKGKEKKLNTWKRNGVAEKLFQSISPPDAASYSALLCGKAQFGDASGAYRLFQEAADAGVSLPVEAFNKLITGASSLKEGHELRWQYVEEMLGTIKQQRLAPNLGTLNAVLETISSMSTNKDSQKQALEIMAEFRALGIEPSLASYYFLLTTFCQNRSNMRSSILVNIMDILQGKSLSIQDPRDVFFFIEAMDICRYHLSDMDLAFRVDQLLHTADNYNLIGDSFKESSYYRNFFCLVCHMGTVKEFMEMYDKLVPNVYVPEVGVMEDIIQTVEMNGAWELLPRLWSDSVMFEYSDRVQLLCVMLGALQKSRSTDKTLLDQLADVAWQIWQRIENQRPDRLNKKIEWTGQMLGDIVQVVLRADRYPQALEIMNCLDQRQQEILGVPSIESLTAFLDKSIEMKEVKNAIWCIQYCSEAGFEDAVKLAQKLRDSLQLSETEEVYPSQYCWERCFEKAGSYQ